MQWGPQEEAQQAKGQRQQEEEQVEGHGDQHTQGQEGAGVLGAPALLQRRGHARRQEPVQQPIAGEHQAPGEAIQEVQAGTGIWGGVEDHRFVSFLSLFLARPCLPSCLLQCFSPPHFNRPPSFVFSPALFSLLSSSNSASPHTRLPQAHTSTLIQIGASLFMTGLWTGK